MRRENFRNIEGFAKAIVVAATKPRSSRNHSDVVDVNVELEYLGAASGSESYCAHASFDSTIRENFKDTKTFRYNGVYLHQDGDSESDKNSFREGVAKDIAQAVRKIAPLLKTEQTPKGARIHSVFSPTNFEAA